MDLLDSRWTETAEGAPKLEGLDIQTLTASTATGTKRCLLLTARTVTADSVLEYCAFHRRFFTVSKELGGRNTLLVYDLRTTEYTEWVKILAPFITMHGSLKEIYTVNLLCSVVVVGSARIRTFVEGIFTLYNPVRPIRIFQSSDNVATQIATLWSKTRNTKATDDAPEPPPSE